MECRLASKRRETVDPSRSSIDTDTRIIARPPGLRLAMAVQSACLTIDNRKRDICVWYYTGCCTEILFEHILKQTIRLKLHLFQLDCQPLKRRFIWIRLLLNDTEYRTNFCQWAKLRRGRSRIHTLNNGILTFAYSFREWFGNLASSIRHLIGSLVIGS